MYPLRALPGPRRPRHHRRSTEGQRPAVPRKSACMAHSRSPAEPANSFRHLKNGDMRTPPWPGLSPETPKNGDIRKSMSSNRLRSSMSPMSPFSTQNRWCAIISRPRQTAISPQLTAPPSAHQGRNSEVWSRKRSASVHRGNRSLHSLWHPMRLVHPSFRPPAFRPSDAQRAAGTPAFLGLRAPQIGPRVAEPSRTPSRGEAGELRPSDLRIRGKLAQSISPPPESPVGSVPAARAGSESWRSIDRT